ncbi:hypothetical protein ACON3F_20040 [Providencia hangzhouensis]
MNIVWSADTTKQIYFPMLIGSGIQYMYPDISWAVIPIVAILFSINIEK